MHVHIDIIDRTSVRSVLGKYWSSADTFFFYYFQAARLLIGLKSGLTNQCNEFRSLETCQKTGFDMLATNI